MDNLLQIHRDERGRITRVEVDLGSAALLCLLVFGGLGYALSALR